MDDQFTFDINLDFLDQHQNLAAPDIKLSMPSLDPVHLFNPSYDVEELALSIANTDNLVQQIKNLQEEKDNIQKQLEDFNESAVSIRELYETEKSERVKLKTLCEKLKTKCNALETELTGKNLDCDQLTSQLENEKGPLTFNELALKFLRATGQLEEEKLLTAPDRQVMFDIREFLQEKGVKLLPLPKRKMRTQKHHMATQCDFELPALPTKSTFTQGTQYVNSTTTRGTSTTVFIKTQSVGTNFPETSVPVTDNLIDILNEMIYNKRPISPIVDMDVVLPSPKRLRSIGTITNLNNVRKCLDYISNSSKSPQIKLSNSRPPSRNMFDSLKNDPYWLTMGNIYNGATVNIPNQNGIPTGPYNGYLPFGPLPLNSSPLLMHSPFTELWNLIGHTVVGLFQNPSRTQLDPNINQATFNDLNERLRNFNFVREDLPNVNQEPRNSKNSATMRSSEFYEENQLPHQDFTERCRNIATSPMRTHPEDESSSNNSPTTSNERNNCTFFRYSENLDVNTLNSATPSKQVIDKSKSPESISVVDEILKLFPETSNDSKNRSAINRLLRSTRSKKARLKLAENLKANEENSNKDLIKTTIDNKEVTKRTPKSKLNRTTTPTLQKRKCTSKIEKKPVKKIFKTSEQVLKQTLNSISNVQKEFCDNEAEDIPSPRYSPISDLSDVISKPQLSVDLPLINTNSTVKVKRSYKKRYPKCNEVNNKKILKTNKNMGEKYSKKLKVKNNQKDSFECEDNLPTCYENKNLLLNINCSENDRLQSDFNVQSEQNVYSSLLADIDNECPLNLSEPSEDEFDSNISKTVCRTDSTSPENSPLNISGDLLIHEETDNNHTNCLTSQQVNISESKENLRSDEKQSSDNLTFKTPDKPVTNKMSSKVNSTFLNDILSNKTNTTGSLIHNNLQSARNKTMFAQRKDYKVDEIDRDEELCSDDNLSEDKEISVIKKRKRSKEVIIPEPIKRSERIKAKKSIAESLHRATYFPIEIGKYTTKGKKSSTYDRSKFQNEVPKLISQKYIETCIDENEKNTSNLTVNLGYFKERSDDELSDDETLSDYAIKLTKDINKSREKNVSEMSDSCSISQRSSISECSSISDISSISENDLLFENCSSSESTTVPEKDVTLEKYPNSESILVAENICVKNTLSIKTEDQNTFLTESPTSPVPQNSSKNTFKISEPYLIPLETKMTHNNSLLSRLISKYNQRSYKKSKTVKPYTSPKITNDFEIQIKSYLKPNENDHITVTDLVCYITKYCINENLITQNIISIIELEPSTNCNTDYIFAEGYLSEAHNKTSELLLHLKPRYPLIVETLLKHVEKFLFNFKALKTSFLTAVNLTQLYMHTTQRYQLYMKKNSARRFISKCIYYYKDLAVRMIYEVLCFYPTVLPHREDRTYDRSHPLITVIQHILMNTTYDVTKTDLKTKELLSKLRYQYHFEPFKPQRDEVIENLLSKIRANKCKNVSNAFVLLCKRMSQDQITRNILHEHILPLATEYCQSVEKSSEYDEQIVCVLETISMVIKPLNVDLNILSYTSIYIKFLTLTKRQVVQEAAIQALLRASRFGFVHCFNAIYNYNPKYNLKPITKAMLKSFIYRNEYHFLIKLENQAKILNKNSY